jgi:Mrp family chromosome partitioning ATPase
MTLQTPSSGASQPYAGGAEMLRLVQRLFLSTTNGPAPREVVFCGVGSENGSSFVCANAGKSLAASTSRSVCLVDANLIASRLWGFLEGSATASTADKAASLREQCIAAGENLWVAGADVLMDEGGGLASAAVLKHRLAELRQTFEFVLIDAPGADLSGDATLLGQSTDGVVLVIDAEVTRKITARKVKESFDAANVRLLGAVLNDRQFPIPKGLYNRL